MLIFIIWISPILIVIALFINLTRIFIGLLSSSFAIIWLFIELNLISFISLMLINNTRMKKNSLIKYFCFQAVSSSLILVFFNLTIETALLMTIFIKIAIAPFHLWLITIIEDCNLFIIFWLSTVQKIIPLNMLSLVNFFLSHLIFISISILYATLFILIQTKLKKILVSSSVYRANWIVATFMVNSILAWAFFFTYSCVLGLIFLIRSKYRLGTNSRSSQFKSLNIRFHIIYLIWALAGIPPSPLFFIKLLAIIALINKIFFFISFMLLLSAIIRVYMYTNSFVSHSMLSSRAYVLQKFVW